eukprot:TRINITY_DN3664_c0_g1_i1.p1 TRINITY_DN3664_c0_g1~~TRINITY_DN3664_c0_g1_i1.p1  ORF type:complete len:2004 (+),score=734.58 TRINITY_DN3664_c0_g1_i1:308-6013(+)
MTQACKDAMQICDATDNAKLCSPECKAQVANCPDVANMIQVCSSTSKSPPAPSDPACTKAYQTCGQDQSPPDATKLCSAECKAEEANCAAVANLTALCSQGTSKCLASYKVCGADVTPADQTKMCSAACEAEQANCADIAQMRTNAQCGGGGSGGPDDQCLQVFATCGIAKGQAPDKSKLCTDTCKQQGSKCPDAALMYQNICETGMTQACHDAMVICGHSTTGNDKQKLCSAECKAQEATCPEVKTMTETCAATTGGTTGGTPPSAECEAAKSTCGTDQSPPDAVKLCSDACKQVSTNCPQITTLTSMCSQGTNKCLASYKICGVDVTPPDQTKLCGAACEAEQANCADIAQMRTACGAGPTPPAACTDAYAKCGITGAGAQPDKQTLCSDTCKSQVSVCPDIAKMTAACTCDMGDSCGDQKQSNPDMQKLCSAECQDKMSKCDAMKQQAEEMKQQCACRPAFQKCGFDPTSGKSTDRAKLCSADCQSQAAACPHVAEAIKDCSAPPGSTPAPKPAATPAPKPTPVPPTPVPRTPAPPRDLACTADKCGEPCVGNGRDGVCTETGECVRSLLPPKCSQAASPPDAGGVSKLCDIAPGTPGCPGSGISICAVADATKCASMDKCESCGDGAKAFCVNKGGCRCDLLRGEQCEANTKCALVSSSTIGLLDTKKCVDKAAAAKAECSTKAKQTKDQCAAPSCKWIGYRCVAADLTRLPPKLDARVGVVLQGLDGVDIAGKDFAQSVKDDVSKAIVDFLNTKPTAEVQAQGECIQANLQVHLVPETLKGEMQVDIKATCDLDSVTEAVQATLEEWKQSAKQSIWDKTKQTLKDMGTAGKDAADKLKQAVEDLTGRAWADARDKAKKLRGVIGQGKDGLADVLDSVKRQAGAFKAKANAAECTQKINEALGSECGLATIAAAWEKGDTTICSKCGVSLRAVLDSEEREKAVEIAKAELKSATVDGLSWVEKACDEAAYKVLWNAGKVLCGVHQDGTQIMGALKDKIKPAVDKAKAAGTAIAAAELEKVCDHVPAVVSTMLQRQYSFESRGVGDAVSESDADDLAVMQGLCLRKDDRSRCGADSGFVSAVLKGASWKPDSDSSACTDPCKAAYQMVHEGLEGATSAMLRCGKDKLGSSCAPKITTAVKAAFAAGSDCSPVSILASGSCSKTCSDAYKAAVAVGCCAAPLFDSLLAAGLSTLEEMRLALQECDIDIGNLPPSCAAKDASAKGTKVDITVSADVAKLFELGDATRKALVVDLITAAGGKMDAFTPDKIELEPVGRGVARLRVFVPDSAGAAGITDKLKGLQEDGELQMKNLKELIETNGNVVGALEQLPIPDSFPFAKRDYDYGGGSVKDMTVDEVKLREARDKLRAKLADSVVADALGKARPSKEDLSKVRASAQDIKTAIEEVAQAGRWQDASGLAALLEMAYSAEDVKDELAQMAGAAQDAAVPLYEDMMTQLSDMADKIRKMPETAPAALADGTVAAVQKLQRKKIDTQKLKRKLGELHLLDVDPAAVEDCTREATARLAAMKKGGKQLLSAATEEGKQLRRMLRDSTEFFNQGAQGLCAKANATLRAAAMRVRKAMGNAIEARPEDSARFAAMCAMAGDVPCGAKFAQAGAALREAGRCSLAELKWSDTAQVQVPAACVQPLKDYVAAVGDCLHEEIDGLLRGKFGDARKAMKEGITKGLEAAGAALPAAPKMPDDSSIQVKYEVTIPGVAAAECQAKLGAQLADAVRDDIKDATGLSDRDLGSVSCKVSTSLRRGRAASSEAVVTVGSSSANSPAVDSSYTWDNTVQASDGSTSASAAPKASGGESPESNEDDDEGSSGGMIAGILAGCLACLGVMAAAMFVKKRRSGPHVSHQAFADGEHAQDMEVTTSGGGRYEQSVGADTGDQKIVQAI